MMRVVRERSLARALGPRLLTSAVRARLVALTGIVAVGLIGFWLAPLVAARIGTTPDVVAGGHYIGGAPPHWLAGKFDGLAHWWQGLSP